MRKNEFFPRAFSCLLALSLLAGPATLPALATGEDAPDAQVTEGALPAEPTPEPSATTEPAPEPAAVSEAPTTEPEAAATPEPTPEPAEASDAPAPVPEQVETSAEPAPELTPAAPEDGEAVALDEPAPEEEPIEVLGDDFTPYSSVTGNGESITFELCASTWYNQYEIPVKYADGSSETYRMQVKTSEKAAFFYREWTPVGDLSFEVIGNAPNFKVTVVLPVSALKSDDFTLTFDGQSYSSAELGLGSTEPSAAPSAEPSTAPSAEPSTAPTEAPSNFTDYKGQLYDWSGVPMVDIEDVDENGNPKQGNTVDQMGVVWDGDSVYILLKADGTPTSWDPNTYQGNWNSVCGAGTHGNGQYAITTDLGKTLLIQANKDGTVSGVSGAEVVVNNKDWFGAPHYWEIKIPADQLPEYKESFDFGLYLSAPSITGVKDLQGGDDENKDFNGIVIDGKYEDWKWYPHEVIEYATAGTQEHVTDSEGALYAEDGKLYAHVSTDMPAHLQAQGGEFLAAISIAFNGDRAYKGTPDQGNFYPQLIDENGNVVNEGTRLEKGTHTFTICDTRNTNPDRPIFGTMKVTVNGEKDEMELELDLKKVAEYIGCDPQDFQLIEAQFGRLGQKWLSIAGTPTGAWLGIGLCLAAVGGVYAVDVRKKRKNQA